MRVDVLQQRLDGRAASAGKRARPAIRTETGSHIPFSLFSKVVDGFVDSRCARAFGYGITRAEGSGRQDIVPALRRRGGQRRERIHERELVVQLPAADETLSNTGDPVLVIAAPTARMARM